MDNQKSNEGSGRNIGSEGAGSSMGKDMGSELHTTIDKSAGAAHAGVDKVAGALTSAGSRMDEKSRQLADAYRHFADTGRGYVRSSPVTSVLVAVGAGYVLSRLLSRRH